MSLITLATPTTWADTDEEDMAQGVLPTRDADDIATYISENSKTVDQIMREKFVQIKDDDYLYFIMNHINKKYNLSDVSESTKNELKSYDEKTLAKHLVCACDRAIKTGRR